MQKWSEIFTDFELRHKFINEKLNLERKKLQKDYTSAEEIIQNLEKNTAVMETEKVYNN